MTTKIEGILKKYNGHIDLYEGTFGWDCFIKDLQPLQETTEEVVEISRTPRTTDSYGPKFKCTCGCDGIRGYVYCPLCGAKIKRVD